MNISCTTDAVESIACHIVGGVQALFRHFTTEVQERHGTQLCLATTPVKGDDSRCHSLAFIVRHARKLGIRIQPSSGSTAHHTATQHCYDAICTCETTMARADTNQHGTTEHFGCKSGNPVQMQVHCFALKRQMLSKRTQ